MRQEGTLSNDAAESISREALFISKLTAGHNMDSLDPNQNLREVLDIDSFDLLRVLVALNDKFGVDIPEADYRRVSTLNGMIDYLNKHMPSQTR